MGYLAWDLRRALDVLEALPEVDARRLGCYGLSLGGEMTLLTTALDQRIKAACVSGFFTSYRSTYLHEQHCGCGYVPRLACKLEHVDIAALIAPRPLLVEAGTEDPSFRPEAARAGVEELRGYYGLLGAQERLASHVFEGRHEISGAQAFPWLARWLSGQADAGLAGAGDR